MIIGSAGDDHLAMARESLRDLLDDPRVPDQVRGQLQHDYDGVRQMLDKLEHGHVHLAVFGRVGVGKSSLLNALLGERRFSTSPLHGETRTATLTHWVEERSGGVFLIDTPGIDEVGGEEREAAAREAAARADLLMFVVEADLTAVEIGALRDLADARRPLLLVLNKVDRYSEEECRELLDRLAERTDGLIAANNIITVSADPRTAVGGRATRGQPPSPVAADVERLRTRLWNILETEGKTLAALNASLFAGRLSETLGRRIVKEKRRLAQRIVRTYCIAKGVAVAVNPVPVADLAAAALVDAGMVVHLSRVYGLPMTRREAGSLVTVIVTQMAALMGTVWAVHLVSSALKLGTGGMSVVLTAGAQGAVAYYSTYIVGQAAERYFAAGKSWGDAGPRAVMAEILESIDRDSILRQARDDLKGHLTGARG
ncbi:MAG: GTP-binding protein [Chromatiales bacterium]|nr:GTP-binding protein [Chromatiales bacterium]